MKRIFSSLLAVCLASILASAYPRISNNNLAGSWYCDDIGDEEMPIGFGFTFVPDDKDSGKMYVLIKCSAPLDIDDSELDLWASAQGTYFLEGSKVSPDIDPETIQITKIDVRNVPYDMPPEFTELLKDYCRETATNLIFNLVTTLPELTIIRLTDDEMIIEDADENMIFNRVYSNVKP